MDCCSCLPPRFSSLAWQNSPDIPLSGFFCLRFYTVSPCTTGNYYPSIPRQEGSHADELSPLRGLDPYVAFCWASSKGRLASRGVLLRRALRASIRHPGELPPAATRQAGNGPACPKGDHSATTPVGRCGGKEPVVRLTFSHKGTSPDKTNEHGVNRPGRPVESRQVRKPCRDDPIGSRLGREPCSGEVTG